MQGSDSAGGSRQRRRRPSPPADPTEQLRFLGASLAPITRGVIVVDASGRAVFTNDAGQPFSQRPPLPQTPVGEQAAEPSLRYPDGRPISRGDAPLERALRGEAVLDMVTVERRPSGDAYVSNTASPVRDERGAIIGAYHIWRDVGERGQVKEALQREKDFTAAVVDTITALMVVLDPEGRIVRFNRSCEESTGYSFDEVKGQHVWDFLLLSEEIESVKAVFQQLRAGQFPIEHENYWITNTGERRLIVWSNTALTGDDGLVEYIIATGIDVTERRRAKAEREQLLAELRQANERLLVASLRELEQASLVQRRAAELQAVLDNMVDGVFVCDVERRITLVNAAGIRMLGLASEEDLQRAMGDLVEALQVRNPDGSPSSIGEDPLFRALAGEVVVEADRIVRNQRNQHDVYIRTSAAPIRDRDGNIVGAVAVVRDVTDLAEFDRLKDQFIEVAAHELKTPVTIMKGYAQALLRSGRAKMSPQRSMLSAIDRGADRIQRIIEDLLQISKLQSNRLQLVTEPIDLTRLVREIVDRTALNTTKHRLRMVGAQPAVVRADRDRLEQAVCDLLDNAVRYSPAGGEIAVEVAVQGGEAIVSVADQGVGIPEEKQARIFQRFYRAHTQTPYDYGGLGVGLYIAHEIINRQGGRMWFESEEGKGSTFFFALPLMEQRQVE